MRVLVLFALLAAQRAAPSPQDSGTVTGQIRSTSGASVSGIRIAAMVAPAPGTVATEPATLERLTTTDSNGRFRLENIRPGRYYITAGFVDAPTYFPGVSRVADARAVVVTAGSMLPGTDFALAQSPGVTVSGRIKGAPGNMPGDYIHVALVPTGTTPRPVQRLDTVVSPDGTFEFQRIGPGTYSVLTDPVLANPSPNIRIEVKDIDVGPVELAIGPVIVGQVTVEDASPLPSSLTYATAGNSIVNTPSLVSLVAFRPSNPTTRISFGRTVRGDGAFMVVNFQPGEYQIAARLPFGYNIKSLTYGDIDLLKTTLKISDSATGSVRMVLTNDPPPGTSGGMKVSGRVTGALPPTNAWIAMQTGAQGFVSAGGIGETLVRPDGTFEFQHVPPGAYSALLMPRQGIAPQIAVVVEDVDVANVEIPNILPETVLTLRPPATPAAAVLPGSPGTLAIQPPSYPSGVRVTGRVVVSTAANGEIPRTVVLFGPRDGLSVQGPIRGDGTFEIRDVPAGNYDARTLPLMIPPVSTRVAVGDKEVSGVTLSAPVTRPNP